MNCPRCCKLVLDGYAHTCKPTEGWRKMEAEIAELKRQLEERTEQLRKEYLSAIDWAGKHQEAIEKLTESQAREARLRDELKTIARVTTDHIATDIADEALALPHDDTALKEYHDSIVDKCAVIAGNACLVPPDGGTPTEEEAAVSEEAARRIRNLKGGV